MGPASNLMTSLVILGEPVKGEGVMDRGKAGERERHSPCPYSLATR